MDRWTGGWVGICVAGSVKRQRDRQINGQMGKWADGWINGWNNAWVDEWIFLTAEMTTEKREGRIEVEKHTHMCRKHKNISTKSWYIPTIAMWRIQIWCRKKGLKMLWGPIMSIL